MSTATPLTSLITQESSKLIEEVRDFLESTVTDLEITDEVQRINATTLGNELQKKKSIIEKARKAEKSIWDDKAKAVQNEFMPVILAIDDKKDLLGKAITKYNRLLEDRRIARQKELDDKAATERASLESFAGKREEKLKMYESKLEAAQAGIAAITNDPERYNTMVKHIKYLIGKVNEFTEKVTETVQAAAQVVAPVYVPEEQVASKGARVTMEATVRETDHAAFVASCVERGEEHLLIIDEQKVKNQIKITEGRFQRPGTVCTWSEKTSFSGR